MSADLFNAVVDVANTGRFLPCDKDQRWFAKKDERVLSGEILHSSDRTVIPSVSLRGQGLVRIYHYGAVPDRREASEWGQKLAVTHGARGGAKLIWCDQNPQDAKGRLMAKALSYADSKEISGVIELHNCQVADTFKDFAEDSHRAGEGGFLFLHQRMLTGQNDGTVLVAVENSRIVGAVGPLSTMTDAVGICFQPPQYFTVLPRFRGRGHGRRLWQASMAWGKAHGATYKVLQAACGSAAETLYLSEGMASLGYLHEAKVA